MAGDGGKMERFLSVLQQVCSKSVYEDLTHSLHQDHLLDILQKCCAQSNTVAGLPVHDQISDVLIVVGETALSLISVDREDQCKASAEHVHQVKSLLALYYNVISSLMKMVGEDSSSEVVSILRHVMKKTASKIVVVCVGKLEEYQWKSEETTKSTQEILQLVCKGCRTKSTSELLIGSTLESLTTSPLFPSGILPEILDICQTKLLFCPTLAQITHWCVSQVKYPHLGTHLSKFLTLVLKLSDDHQIQNKVLGMKCLYHILKNTNAAELIWYGRCDMIFEILHRSLYTREADLLEVLYPCILESLQIYKSRGRQEAIHQYDQIIQVILTTMEYESNEVLRRIHAFYLKAVVNHIGIHLLNYLKRFLTLVYSYLDVYDKQRDSVRFYTLEVLKVAMLNLWPRIKNHAADILEALLKLIVDCGDMEDKDTREKLLESCVQCLVVLKCCCPQVTETLHNINERVSHTHVRQCVSIVLSQE